MESTQTIFGRNTPPPRPKYFAPKKQQQRPRKKRSDAKHDIKFKLLQHDKKLLRLAAMDAKLSLTAFASEIVKRELLQTKIYDEYDYENEGQFIHVMLNNDLFEMVKTLAVEWDLPYRRVVHRMVKDYIERQKGPQIKDWRD